MITASFTERELVDEIKKDIGNILMISDAKDKKVKRIILKASVFPVRVHSFVTSPLKNKWMILWEAKTKKNIGDNSIITFVCLHETTHGRYAYMPTWVDGNLRLIVYPPHFFSRYSARMEIPLFGVDLIKHFFERNASYGFTHQTEYIADQSTVEHVYGSCTDGVALGVQSAMGDAVLFKTFVSYPMLKGKQIEDFAKAEEFRKEIHEKDVKA